MMRPPRAAVTMIEIMISVLLLGMALVPIFDLIRSGAQRAQNTQDEIVAANIAAELVEQIAAMPFQAVPVVNGLPLTDKESGTQLGRDARTLLVLSPLPERMDRVLSVESFSPSLKKVSATVSWGKDPRRHVDFATFMEWTP